MTYLHPIMIISLIIILVQIILFITRLYNYSIFLIIFSFVLYLIVGIRQNLTHLQKNNKSLF